MKIAPHLHSVTLSEAKGLGGGLPPRRLLRQRRWRLTTLAGVVCLLLAMGGCDWVVPWARIYSGDGTYGTGPGVYRVRLGAIPLGHPGVRTFTLRRLGPGREWSVGFRVDARDSNMQLYDPGSTSIKERFRPDAVVRLTLRNEKGEAVFSAERPLATWSWNWNFAHLDGKGEEYQSAPHTFSFRRFGVGPDGGWGTHFTPRLADDPPEGPSL